MHKKCKTLCTSTTCCAVFTVYLHLNEFFSKLIVDLVDLVDGSVTDPDLYQRCILDPDLLKIMRIRIYPT